MAQFIRMASVQDIPMGGVKAFEHRYHRIAICHTEEGFHALADECSHDSAQISDGHIRGNEIVCARHGARFDIRTGAVTAPPAVVPIDKYELKVEGNNIYVLLD